MFRKDGTLISCFSLEDCFSKYTISVPFKNYISIKYHCNLCHWICGAGIKLSSLYHTQPKAALQAISAKFYTMVMGYSCTFQLLQNSLHISFLSNLYIFCQSLRHRCSVHGYSAAATAMFIPFYTVMQQMCILYVCFHHFPPPPKYWICIGKLVFLKPSVIRCLLFDSPGPYPNNRCCYRLFINLMRNKLMCK